MSSCLGMYCYHFWYFFLSTKCKVCTSVPLDFPFTPLKYRPHGSSEAWRGSRPESFGQQSGDLSSVTPRFTLYRSAKQTPEALGKAVVFVMNKVRFLLKMTQISLPRFY